MPSISNLAIPGGWSEREVAIGSRVFRLLVPADPDNFLNYLVEPADRSQPHLSDPYWAKLWPAALHLAEAVLRSQQTGAGSQTEARSRTADDCLNPKSEIRNPKFARCLELGCGSGLTGLAALAAGLEVTFSDYVPQAVELALENAARNGLAGARGLVLDWRDPPDLQFSLILAADVTYDRANLADLLMTLERMLARGGEAWLGDAGRSPAVDFYKLALARGWRVTLYDEHDQLAHALELGRYRRMVLRRRPDDAP